MVKNILVISILTLIILSKTPKTFAQEYCAGSSAALSKTIGEKAPDSRAAILREYLKQYNSPLVPYAQTFVETADKYQLDWKLVAAISGVESTFGQEIPNDSFNGWGWGIFGDNMIRFSSWTQGIETVSEGLRNKYINQWGAQDVYAIGKFYAASPTWAQRVTYFMDSINKFKDSKLSASLAISL
jgi:hypothetical protein